MRAADPAGEEGRDDDVGVEDRPHPERFPRTARWAWWARSKASASERSLCSQRRSSRSSPSSRRRASSITWLSPLPERAARILTARSAASSMVTVCWTQTHHGIRTRSGLILFPAASRPPWSRRRLAFDGEATRRRGLPPAPDRPPEPGSYPTEGLLEGPHGEERSGDHRHHQGSLRSGRKSTPFDGLRTTDSGMSPPSRPAAATATPPISAVRHRSV